MGFMACNSCGHLANHLDVAPQYSAITFGISNTIVSICKGFKRFNFDFVYLI
jgi:hypothetical protein